MSDVVVPDSITPYYGFKWLLVKGGVLWSPRGPTGWPVGKPLEAKCGLGSEWRWAPVRSGCERMPPDPSRVVVSTVTVTTPQVTVAPSQPPPLSLASQKPLAKLPPGLVWSWEPGERWHDAPDEGCACGVYVASSIDRCRSYVRPGQPMVLVKVALWGRVIEGEVGARGQFAYPQVIAGWTGLETDRWAVTVGERYGIKTREPKPKPPPPLSETTLAEYRAQLALRPSMSTPTVLPTFPWGWVVVLSSVLVLLLLVFVAIARGG